MAGFRCCLAGSRKPEIVCLQELKVPDDKFPELAIPELGYRAIWHGEKSWNNLRITPSTRPPHTSYQLSGMSESEILDEDRTPFSIQIFKHGLTNSSAWRQDRPGDDRYD